MADKEKYCQNCGWQGHPKNDLCPRCNQLGRLMDVPERQGAKGAKSSSATSTMPVIT